MNRPLEEAGSLMSNEIVDQFYKDRYKKIWWDKNLVLVISIQEFLLDENLLFLVNIVCLNTEQLKYINIFAHYSVMYLNKEKECSFHIYFKKWYFIVYGWINSTFLEDDWTKFGKRESWELELQLVKQNGNLFLKVLLKTPFWRSSLRFPIYVDI